MPAPVAVLVEVDGEPVFQAYIAYCAICRDRKHARCYRTLEAQLASKIAPYGVTVT